MNENSVTIVTAFFDIGRKKFNGEFSRSNEKYIEYFKFWAKIKNNLIVYTDSKMGEEVIKIRKKFGLEEKTKIIVIEDYTLLEPKLLEKMERVSSSSEFLKYRYMDNPADNNALYDYVMLIKSWCLNDVAEKKLADGILCWLDFGFNHGGDIFTNSEEFNFELKVDFNENKITLFSLNEYDNKPIFQIVQSYAVYLMGSLMYVPARLASKLWNDIKEALESLLEVGFIDDDQTLLLMASIKHPDRYNVVKSDWFMPLKEYGGTHLTVKEKKENIKQGIINKILTKYRIYKRNKNCIKNLKKLFMKNNLD